MYKMKADGVVFYDPASDDMTLQVLSPKASFELNKAGSLEFTLLPGNVMYHSLNKLKTVITLEQDDEIIFCGRVMETTTDLYNRKEVYCEGELAFLYDSLQRPYEFEGKPADLFRQLLSVHNEQVEEYKRFEPGIITAGEDEDITVDGSAYADTLSDIRSLLVDEHGGYLRVRRENGVRYLDYVSSFDQACSQEINFGVNLVDIESKINAQEVCTVLVPVGKLINGEYTNIRKANDGKDYIEDTEGVAKYGRIVKTYTWSEVTDPQELLNLGLKHMAKLKAETTLTITAVDMHACGVDVDGIRLGDTVHLHSVPHGLDKDEVCTGIELDIEKPEKSEYTFGLPLESLTDSNANTVKQFSSWLNEQHRWLTETDEALNITVENINLIGHRTTVIEADFNAAKAEIGLKANQDDMDILETRVNSAEVRISAAESEIDLKASRTSVNEMGERVTAAEVKLDGVESTITLQAEEIKAKADKIDLQGFVTMDDFETVQGWAENFSGVTVSASNVVAGEGDFDVLVVGQLNGENPAWKGGTFVTNLSVTQNKNNATVMLSDGTTKWIQWVESVTITPTTAYINYMGKN